MREKLIELLENSPYLDVLGGLSYYEEAADHLIANGVILKDDTSCMQRFIATESSLDIKRMISEWENKPVVFYADRGESIIPIPQWEWIPVTERLPEEDGKYLVFEQSSGRTNTSILRFAKDARKVDRYDFKGRWKNAWYEYDSEWGHYTVDSVTHWMPLPEPPKEVE